MGGGRTWRKEKRMGGRIGGIRKRWRGGRRWIEHFLSKKNVIFHILIRSLKGTVVNRALLSQQRGSLEITVTFPLNRILGIFQNNKRTSFRWISKPS